MKMATRLILLLISAIASCKGVPVENAKKVNNLVVLMLDGCRWDYFSRELDKHPGYKIFQEQGVTTQYVQPIFPSSSFQSWTTIVTGLYSESHQIFDNDMVDRENGYFFTLGNDSSTENPKWWTGHVPIWSTLTHQGLNVSLHHWSKCQVPFEIDGEEILPFSCTPYVDSGNAYTDNIQVLKEAFSNVTTDLAEGKVQVAFVYYPNIDNVGHRFGPDSIETKTEVTKVDAAIKEFIEGLEQANLTSKTNFIILGDHGMTENKKLTFKRFTDGLKPETIESIERIISSGNIMVKNASKVDQVFEDLVHTWSDSMNIYKKADIPDYLRIKQANYVHDIVLSPKNLTVFGGDPMHADLYFPPNDGSDDQEEQAQGGAHGFEDITEGYDQEGSFPDVRSVFLALGPDFKAKHTNQWIKLVDEYQVMIHVLSGIEPRPHNGTWDRVKDMFKAENDDDGNGAKSLISNISAIITVTMLAVFA